MLSIEEIKQLIELVDASKLDELELEVKDTKLKLKKNKEVTEVVRSAPVAVPAAPTPQTTAPTQAAVEETPAAESENLEVITSPMVGTFYASRTPEDAPFVNPGSKVANDSIVCIIEAMKLFNDITADIDGEIAEVLVTNGELVEFGQPLFKVRKK
ncbi:Biotin carboxyl carrier protein of acetyl-CoA carboxylase [Listeria grayi]|uniref:Biotin carboxyl carrier protein of acetyl-CoA carboxylase n=1 Tax=Listeria grayi FSL F6-1183 TaxID=1265827 RepID=A0A829R943_LISGR|nr:acetyl-CoA carboxylase biotin carboxyl carrier protein [Listeria grayi]EUJ30050.1 acetyl-CoA carboxylase, biotin carboxyl carrier protein [Listeria grayi FSL F6-1183]VEI33892.1 Biotin carboxyl carrier protein of acetyl-CoA carboxylase [Listeria grayi]